MTEPGPISAIETGPAADAPPARPRYAEVGGVTALAITVVLAACSGRGSLVATPLASPSVHPSAVPEPSETAVAQPSAPPAEPITASVEQDGIRLTITLDRDRTVYGQRVLATATVENIGADTVYWGHSGTCVHPAGVQARPDDPVRVRPGRDDWPGDEGVLKLVTVDERLADTDPSYGFTPQEWLDREGNFGCTTDLVVSELPAGGSLVQVRGWDTLGHYSMPPSPGGYTVDATFAFMSRGEEPSPVDATDRFSVTVSVPLVVDGPEIDLLSPGEAVDALLSDQRFRTLLADAPRDLWVQQDLTFVDSRWELVLYLSASDTEVEPVDALVGIVDARSGVVLDAMREPRPPGG